jgi:hypothetical protein
VEIHFDTPLATVDTVMLHCTGLVGLDTVCEALINVRLLSQGPIGNTTYIGDSICLEGQRPTGTVNEPGSGSTQYKIYPNPARERVTFEGAGEATVVRVYDALGRMVSQVRGSVWNVPPHMQAGSYEVMIASAAGRERWMGHVTIVP